jgi:hypothetical protein
MVTRKPSCLSYPVLAVLAVLAALAEGARCDSRAGPAMDVIYDTTLLYSLAAASEGVYW